MFKLIREFLVYKKFVTSITKFTDVKKIDLEEARSYRNERTEDAIYDACKRKLFTEFTNGQADKRYAEGFMAAIAVHSGYNS
ncbi:hypothetical protein LAJ55_13845, partial [Streptococcus pneumoniae]|uniref:hypothetical protein n=1 Tax=Streptococcus pneumoniae TaxID=1313 RepID=UPI001CC068EA